ncbi:MAG: SDR family NAD(P)-dependent oxidoreductase [Leptospiraceae bacterium]
MKISGNTVLITGGTSGIGLALANAFHSAGNQIIITGRDKKKLRKVLNNEPHWMGFAADLSTADQTSGLVGGVKKAGEPNILVNNAGIQCDIGFLRDPIDPAHLFEEFRVNLEAPLRLIQEFLPSLLARQEAAIINVTSALGEVPKSIFPVYSASKAALSAYTCALRVQLKDTAVQVMELVPPLTATPMSAKRNGAKMMPEDLAKAALEGLADGSAVVRPGRAGLLHQLHRFAPGIASKIVEAGA